MVTSANDLIGALVYRTQRALNQRLEGLNETAFSTGVREHYKYYNVLFTKYPDMHLWHIPGTQSEILDVYNALTKDAIYGAAKKFPAVLNYQNVIQEHGLRAEGRNVRLQYQLAFVAPVDSQWLTQERDRIVMKWVLRVIYEEFIRQIHKSGWFLIPLSGIKHNYVEVFTTGTSFHQVVRMQYGDYLDAIQLTDLELTIPLRVCERINDEIEQDSDKVTDTIKELLDIINKNKNNSNEY